MIKQYVLLCLQLLVSVHLFSQVTAVPDTETITKFLYEQVSDDSPGLAIGIVKDGQIVYENYMGYANMEYKLKVDKNTRFNIASNAKQFTALCIFQLSKSGKLNLGDDFRKYLPKYYKNIKEKITISNLITHTSGIRDYCDLMALTGKTWWKQFIDNEDVLELLKTQEDLNFRPGTATLYSNSNYILLTEIVKKVTGQNFSQYAKSMFEALKMPNSQFITHYGAIIPYKARPYGNWGTWREEPAITEVHGDGFLFTNLLDQLQWEQILQKNDGTYFSKQFINQIQSPVASSINDSYGYGLFFDTYKGLNYIWHDGVTGAMRASFVRFPSENLSIVIMSNNRNTALNNLAWKIIPTVLGFDEEEISYPEKPDNVEELSNIQDVLGNYRDENGTIIRITEKEGTLYREMYQRDPIKLIPVQGGLFEYETIKGLKMNFTNIGTSNQNFTLYKSTQDPSTYRKFSDLLLNGYDRNQLNGRFYNDETGTEIILQFLSENNYSLTKNGRERKAELMLDDYLRMNSYEIRIIKNKENEVVGLSVDNNRIRNVIFNKS